MDFVRSRKTKLSIDLAPLIDVVFQLLVFFMLSSTFIKPAISLTLPSAKVQDQAQTEHVSISINAQGEMFVNNARSSWETLQADVRQALDGKTQKAVHIKGDELMPYKFFVRAMDIARQAGAQQVHIVHQVQQTK